MRVLITGGAGFIGLNLAREFVRRGHTVTIVDNFARGIRDRDLNDFLERRDNALIRADLLDPKALDLLPTDFEVICHFAAILGVEKVRLEPLAVLQDNLLMNVGVLHFARRQHRLHRFVSASTSEVYAGTLEKFSMTFPTREDTPLALPELSAPRTSYMLSKIYGEALANHSGLPFTVVRPHNIYGPRMGMSHVVPQVMQRIWQAKHGEEIVVYSPEHRRTFCYAEDAARLIAAAAECPACAGQTLNVGNPQPEVSMLELSTLICDVMDRPVRLVPGPVTPGSPRRRQPDIAAIVGMTGETPHTTLRDGLERTYEWYREHIFAPIGQPIL